MSFPSSVDLSFDNTLVGSETNLHWEQDLAWHRMFVFGDSLSVTPQEYKDEFPPKPSLSSRSRLGTRYSNGWVAVEYLRDSLNIPCSRFHNFAEAGATTFVMQRQINEFKKHIFVFHNDTNKKDLCIVFGGGNNFADFLNHAVRSPMSTILRLAMGSFRTEISSLINFAIESIFTLISNLYKLGLKNVLITNLPDALNVPFLQKLLSEYHNKLVTTKEFFLKVHQDARIIIWDLTTIVGDMRRNPSTYGLCKHELYQNARNNRKSAPEKTLFFDSLGHFTTKAHLYLSISAYQLVTREFSDISIPVRPRPSLRRFVWRSYYFWPNLSESRATRRLKYWMCKRSAKPHCLLHQYGGVVYLTFSRGLGHVVTISEKNYDLMSVVENEKCVRIDPVSPNVLEYLSEQECYIGLTTHTEASQFLAPTYYPCGSYVLRLSRGTKTIRLSIKVSQNQTKHKLIGKTTRGFYDNSNPDQCFLKIQECIDFVLKDLSLRFYLRMIPVQQERGVQYHGDYYESVYGSFLRRK